MHIMFHTAPSHLNAIIPPTSMSRHQNFLKTCSNKMGHSRRTSVQNYTGFDFTVVYINVIQYWRNGNSNNNSNSNTVCL